MERREREGQDAGDQDGVRDEDREQILWAVIRRLRTNRYPVYRRTALVALRIALAVGRAASGDGLTTDSTPLPDSKGEAAVTQVAIHREDSLKHARLRVKNPSRISWPRDPGCRLTTRSTSARGPPGAPPGR